jgi:2,3-bisphosphoglycerate-dependent phosphoglycerate mutase
MQFYFIRHAESANNALWARTGSSQGRQADPPLSDIGRQQAQLLAHFLAQRDPEAPADETDRHNRRGFDLTHLYCSLMERSVATGTAVAQAIDLPLVAWPDIHERGGLYLDDAETGEPAGQAGANRAYFMEQYAHLILPETVGEAGWWNRPFEPHDQAQARAHRFLYDLLARHGGSDDRVAIISHGGFFRDLLHLLLDSSPLTPHLPEPLRIRFAVNNCSITRLDFTADTMRLIYLNRVDFLPGELMTD